ncbi:AbrB family transcriptional regulator [Silicimonas algicola]|nr:AbrB family transcriptional regulator [Silicimonas algicola]
MPLPFMLGAMVFVTIAAMIRVPVEAPATLRKIMVPILGVMLGSGFHPGLFDHVNDWLLTFAVLPFFVGTAFAGAFAFYRFVGKYDMVTAYFASAPGGLNDMMILGGEAGGDERRIALAHASRIFIVVTGVVFFYAFVLDVRTTGSSRPYLGFSAVSLRDLGILLACAVVGATLAPRLRLPAPQILGPMILSALVHLTGFSQTPPPTPAVNAAQLVIGTVVGCRFAGAALREVVHDLALALGASTAMLSVALVSAFAIQALTNTEADAAFLAFSPGGLPEMSLLALSLDADVAYVATMHIIRITIVIAMAPIVFRLFGKR